MENTQENIKRLINRFLNDKGWEILCGDGLCSMLLEALFEEDLRLIEINNIYINPIYSPASKSKINIDIKVQSSIISVDINIFSRLSKEEGVAVILHELGHVFNPAPGDQGEFNADAYAVRRGYREFNIQALNRFRELFPERFDKPITDSRIEKMNEILL